MNEHPMVDLVGSADHHIETDTTQDAAETWTVPAHMTWFVYFIAGTNKSQASTISVAINDGAAKDLLAGDEAGKNLWNSPMPLTLKGGHTITITLDTFAAGNDTYKTIGYWEVHQT